MTRVRPYGVTAAAVAAGVPPGRLGAAGPAAVLAAGEPPRGVTAGPAAVLNGSVKAVGPLWAGRRRSATIVG